ncbi:hypothetical protein KUTeg_013944 [Tegillarca granosa]|uniref:Glutamate decarboxylase n=1 Tax=Tegillarca granosa TaxID=220873 RepID=A0ABQ9EYY8_TEGGR|nr:hypothetical protein KUTeg_013944 [Tegillarca granosa]
MSTKITNGMNGHTNGHLTNGYSNGHCNGVKINGNVPENDNQFLDELYDMMIKEGFEKSRDRNTKVVEFKHPKELKQLIDLEVNKPTDDDRLLNICKDIIKYSVRTGHPRFFNQLFGGLDQYSLGGAWLTETLNTSQYTYEVSPVFTLMEKAILTKMMGYAGFKDGDAIFCPGGSIANMYALNVARYKFFPDVKRLGMQALPKLCILTSEKCHYSIKKAASVLGIGMDNVIPVKADEFGKLIPAEVEANILRLQSEGRRPYLVNVTAGTTVLGAYDPIEPIADICQKYGLWLHVDGAWGGGALISRKTRHLLKGIERADSLTWNPHKMMGAPLQAAAFMTKHKDLLAPCHSANASYLFQQDKFYDVSYDTGDKSIQCGRKVDVLKLWMMWKSRGDLGFEKDIDNLFDCARYLAQKVRDTDGFRLVLENVAPKIKERMTMNGSMLVGYQPDGDRVNFFRMIISNLEITHEDMDFVVNEIDRLGRDL